MFFQPARLCELCSLNNLHLYIQGINRFISSPLANNKGIYFQSALAELWSLKEGCHSILPPHPHSSTHKGHAPLCARCTLPFLVLSCCLSTSVEFLNRICCGFYLSAARFLWPPFSLGSTENLSFVQGSSLKPQLKGLSYAQ